MEFHGKMKDSGGGLGVGAQRDFAEFEPRVDLSMGRKIIGIPQENEEFVGQGARAQRDFAQFEPRVDLSMGRKIIGIPLENEGIRGSGGPTHSAHSLNLSLG